MINYDKLFIGGAWVAPSDPRRLDIVSPHDRSVIGRAAQARPAREYGVVGLTQYLEYQTVTRSIL